MPNDELGNTPTLLTDCECSLPIADVTNCIRFSQFIVFPAPEAHGKVSYLRLPTPASKLFGASVDAFAKAAADRSAEEWKALLRQDKTKRHARQPRGRELRFRRFAGFAAPRTAEGIAAARERVFAGIKARFAPGDYVAWTSRHPVAGLCAVYEQCWEVLGYTRGELVSSISLAPGEQVVLEYHTWDKSTFKSEEELTEELELRLSSKLTRRDSEELVNELSTQTGVKLSEKLNLTIPIPLGDVIVPLGVDASGELTNQLNTKIAGTLNSVTERTEEAATTLRNQHKVRVEVARETGRESKQTRTIANTNRCHTLNCHYFEILSNYRLRTKVKRLAPCVLVEIPNPPITPASVLCHEDILRKVLIDPIFLPGFAAGKLLETAKALAALAPPPAQPVAPVPGGAAQDTGPFNSLRAAILAAWDELQNAADTMGEAAATLLEFNPNVNAKVQAAEDLGDSIFKGFYLALLAANQDAYSAVRTLDNTRGSVDGLEALRRMFASVTHRDYQYTVVKSAVAEGLDALGLPENIVDSLVTVGNLSPIIGITSLAEMVADDAGLHVAIKAAEDRIKEATGSPAGSVAAGLVNFSAIAQGVLTAGAVSGRSQASSISALELAQAQVEFARLKCHIEDYKTHYRQALWLHTLPDERSRLLADLGLGPQTTGELLGFVDGKAAYTLTSLDIFRGATDVVKALKGLREELERQTDITIQLPTGGTTLEAFLGCCDGCEEFIQKSRDAELRTAVARADQEETEAQRRRARLATDPADLSEFVSPPGGSLVVRVEGAGGGG